MLNDEQKKAVMEAYWKAGPMIEGGVLAACEAYRPFVLAEALAGVSHADIDWPQIDWPQGGTMLSAMEISALLKRRLKRMSAPVARPDVTVEAVEILIEKYLRGPVRSETLATRMAPEIVDKVREMDSKQ
jgi:hypothetical protein